MGCDIHMYVEYKRKENDNHWKPFGKKINPGRNYNMFARLAGVRGNFPGISLQPRGLPEDVSWEASSDNSMYVVDKEEDMEEGYVLRSRATRWVEEGSSKWVKNHEGEDTWVTHPDWHSHSWVTCDEFEKVVNEYHSQVEGADSYNKESEYKALLVAMKSLQEDGYKVRVIFWFDN